MGPTNVALVRLMRADKALREAQAHYESAAKSVRVQERRLADLNEKHKLAATNLRELQAKAGNLELDVKSRTEHIEKLRSAQQNAHNNKEYQALLTQINTEKIDKGKAEDEQLKVMEQVERTATETKTLQGQIEETTQVHDTTKAQLGGKLSELQHEIDKLRPERDAAAATVPAKARDMFERMADKYDGEAMAAIARPNPRREEYVCTSCNMDMVADLYNRLHTRDDVVFCPSCKRMLYIPDDLPPEMAVKQRKPVKAKKGGEEEAASVEETGQA